MTAPDGDSFETPTLDNERSNLLQKVSDVGGYAYVSVATQAAAGDIRAAEAAREMAWEQLHSGPWHSVLPVWRDAYSMACLQVAAFHHDAGDFREALRVLDMGLIMGGMLLRSDLDSAIGKVLSKSNAAKGLDAGEGRRMGEVVLNCQRSNEAEVLQVLPIRSLSCKRVEKRSSLSLEEFLCDHFLAGSPVVISNCMNHWPARTKWKDLDYLKRVAGDRTVPVEVGKNYLCTEWKQELITISQLLERIHSGDSTTVGPTYLAQHPLFDQIFDLRRDILVPDYCYAGGGELRPLNAWFGPAGTLTPLHHDPHHNILAQVVGRKYVRLYPASISEDLYPYDEPMLSNSSQVDLDNPDEKQFPKAVDLDFMDCILEEGEMLYIPPKWWHYVRSLATSFSVSFWWSEGSSSPVS
ncbi:lysine-specific demethylase JMJ30 isoform X1 [Telopea speciosissima]|uniref:lysine-specific demethylase JMJ30 isoform X1 n=1 Tax=Telopea speciosissima TaxID=54955 RepID=UPI001CC6B17E|nr:lysine-specific demethylase JMJ30 isoform X1 [Telopea speciosissima]XP_043691862.1 lysine-specific demethylase JMJ30 isoform X1 [Telopea speciosissima]